LQAVPAVSAATAIDALGRCPQNLSTRYARGQLVIPYGATWSFTSPRLRGEVDARSAAGEGASPRV
jgi:hypothetical protein